MHCSGHVDLNMHARAASSWPRDSLLFILILQATNTVSKIVGISALMLSQM